MKAIITHKEVVTQYFKDGVEVAPTANEKLLNAIFNTFETKVSEFYFQLEMVTYKNQKELTAKFWEVARQFENFIHPNDLIIQKV